MNLGIFEYPVRQYLSCFIFVSVEVIGEGVGQKSTHEKGGFFLRR